MLKASPGFVFDSWSFVAHVISDSEFDRLCVLKAILDWKEEFDDTEEYPAGVIENGKSKDRWLIFDNFVTSLSPVWSLVVAGP